MSVSVAASMVMAAIMPRVLIAPQDGEDFPVARRRALADARPSQTTGIAPCHLGGNTAFIQEYQLLRRDGADRFEELLTPLAVRFRIPLLGVERLFFSRSPSLRTRYQTRPRLRWTRASLASFDWISAKVRSGLAATQASTHCCASTPACGLRPG